MANLLIDVLRDCMRAKEMVIHEFVLMPDHIHILLTIPGVMSVEKAMQLIKGRFSFRARRDLGFKGEVWQRGFSDVRIVDEAAFRSHKEYIENNPVKSGLASEPKQFRFSSAHLKKYPGAEAQNLALQIGTTEVVP